MPLQKVLKKKNPVVRMNESVRLNPPCNQSINTNTPNIHQSYHCLFSPNSILHPQSVNQFGLDFPYLEPTKTKLSTALLTNLLTYPPTNYCVHIPYIVHGNPEQTPEKKSGPITRNPQPTSYKRKNICISYHPAAEECICMHPGIEQTRLEQNWYFLSIPSYPLSVVGFY